MCRLLVRLVRVVRLRTRKGAAADISPVIDQPRGCVADLDVALNAMHGPISRRAA